MVTKLPSKYLEELLVFFFFYPLLVLILQKVFYLTAIFVFFQRLDDLPKFRGLLAIVLKAQK